MKKNFTLLLLSAILTFASLANLQAQPTNRTVLAFDAGNANSYVSIPTSPALSPQNFTVEFWVNMSNIGTILSNAEATDNNTPPESGYTLRLEGDRTMQFVIGDGESWQTLNSTNTVAADTWTHVAAVYTGTQMRLYLNGVPNGEKTITTPMMASPQELYFGDDATWPGRRISGKMSDVRLWNVARTQEEIEANINNFLTSTPTGLVANWKLDEGEGTVINDVVSTHDGTRGTGTTWIPSTTTSSKEELDQRVTVWPNPSQGIVQIKMQSGSTGHYKLYSSTGSLVLAGELSNSTALDLSKVEKGLYILRVSDAGQELQKRLILL